MQTFTKENLTAELGIVSLAGLRPFRKKVNTLAAKIVGPFQVETSEGILTCQDGWLCIDARGYPYPVASEEFALIYEEA